MSLFEQTRLIEDEKKRIKIPEFPQTDCQCSGFEEVDCTDLGIHIQGKENTLLSLTLNRSSQQLKEKKYDATLAQHNKEVKEQMKNEYFVMNKNPCNLSLKRKVYFSIGKEGKLEKIRYRRVSCNSWRCPRCAPVKAKAVIAQIKEITILNELQYYLTLTLDPKKLSPEDIFSSTHKIITKLLNHFLTIIRRKTFTYFNKRKQKVYKFNLKNSGKVLKYVWVIEFQKNGLAHLHMLLNQFMPEQVLKKVWTHVGGGHILKIEKARSVQAVANYITKYITKEFYESSTNFRFFERRYSISTTCIRPAKYSTKMFEENTSNFEILLKLRELGLEFVYDKLDNSPTNFGNY